MGWGVLDRWSSPKLKGEGISFGVRGWAAMDFSSGRVLEVRPRLGEVLAERRQTCATDSAPRAKSARFLIRKAHLLQKYIIQFSSVCIRTPSYINWVSFRGRQASAARNPHAL
jgi:hypothetical protein